MSSPGYNVTLHNLSRDVTAAGLAYPDEQLTGVGIPRLREMLTALSLLAMDLTIYEPSSPEIRVKTDRDVFVIRTRYRRLCLVGWETTLRGEDHSIAYILNTITGTTEHAEAAPKTERTFVASAAPAHAAQAKAGQRPRWAKIAALAVLVIGFNAVTAWMLLHPTANPLPAHVMLPDTESRALLSKAAGDYETGTREGSRRLTIGTDGTLRLAKLGAKGALTEERTKTVRGALVDGRAALVTSDPAVLTIKDANTVVLYRTTYQRRQP